MAEGRADSGGPLPPGTRFGPLDDQFILGREIASGSQGRVYECTRLGLGSKYAAKVVSIGMLNTTQSGSNRGRNLLREINIMRELHHPRIVNLIEAFTQQRSNGGICFIVMDLALGGDLFSKIVGGSGLGGGSEPACRHVAKQVLEGIGYMHSHHVIHRDLKVENVLIQSTCFAPEPLDCELHSVKIADFGLSKFLGQAGQMVRHMSTVGTLDYLAPEVMSGHYGLSIDFWSFGIVVYLMLCGVYPFNIYSAEDVTRLQDESLNTSGSWEKVSETGKALARGLLRVDPCDRLDYDGCRAQPWLEASLEEAALVEEALAHPEMPVAPCHGPAPLEAETERTSPPARSDTLCPLSLRTGGSETVQPRRSREPLQPRGVVKKIVGTFAAAVDGVALHLRNGDVQSFGSQAGSPGKGERHTWNLKQDELIIAVSQEDRDAFLGNQLAFLTSLGQIILLHGWDARTRVRFIAPVGTQVVGLQFQGPDLIGTHLERAPAAGQPGAVAGISGSVGSAVDRVSLSMRDGTARCYGGDGGEQQNSFALDDCEYVTIVEQARRNAYLGNNVAFYTSAGRIICFGGVAAAEVRRYAVPCGFQVCGLEFEGSCLKDVRICPVDGDMSSPGTGHVVTAGGPNG